MIRYFLTKVWDESSAFLHILKVKFFNFFLTRYTLAYDFKANICGLKANFDGVFKMLPYLAMDSVANVESRPERFHLLSRYTL